MTGVIKTMAIMWVVLNMQADTVRGWKSNALSSSAHAACVASSNWKTEIRLKSAFYSSSFPRDMLTMHIKRERELFCFWAAGHVEQFELPRESLEEQDEV